MVSGEIRNKEDKLMKIIKEGKKWLIKGPGEGWIFNKKFPTKWKAKIAIEVFKNGGKVSDYWEMARIKAPPYRRPIRVINLLNKALSEIEKLNPNPEEIEEYGDNYAGRGEVTITDNKGYFKPKLDNTWLKKQGGRVHIDIGSGGYHLMLDKNAASEFIKFIKKKRKNNR